MPYPTGTVCCYENLQLQTFLLAFITALRSAQSGSEMPSSNACLSVSTADLNVFNQLPLTLQTASLRVLRTHSSIKVELITAGRIGLLWSV